MSKTIDFAKVESLRQYMLLSQADMAKLLGVSRMTYYSWVSGKPIRRNNEIGVRAAIKKLLAVISDHGWPTPDVRAMQTKYRLSKLYEILEEYDDQGA